MSRFDGTPSWSRAIGDAIEALERNMEALDDVLVGIQSRLSDLEAKSPPKPDGLSDDLYVVRWRPGNHREVARCIGDRWFEDCGATDEVRVNWLSRPEAPHWIGPRVDMREG